ncbi:ABC transporter family substrate-binding protein [Streptomyces sp. LP05-1]|uniref:ABC transporter family substrate-binding protein n=1 Tax=Streptomyces pyxinae TaxID=2970734 RepID=A0ABT2CAN0_9ACTN|nr:ABC transporter family substrate-binding protein [Streptomyces sp. LP05-1]MCS0634466.1 ABC transporter family substrate-binding protein [Streptomyces sp. LP05-1]
MSHVGAPRGTAAPGGPRARALRPAALLTCGVLTVSALAGCSGAERGSTAHPVPQDIAPVARAGVADGGTLKWAVDTLPATLNAFQADADATTGRVTGAVLPTLFTVDAQGRPQLNPDYLESAEVVEREPKQVVLYKLHQQAVWSDGREIGAPDFLAQWQALSGRNSAYWTARNAGYERIEKVERGANDLQVRVTFAKPYADWRALFSPLYPKSATSSPDAFNDVARGKLPVSAGPFQLRAVDAPAGTVTLARNPRWWGRPAKLDTLVLKAVPRAQRTAALKAGEVDLAEVDPATAERIAPAAGPGGRSASPAPGGAGDVQSPGMATTPSAALGSGARANGAGDGRTASARAGQAGNAPAAAGPGSRPDPALSGYVVRKSLEPAYTQLALNGESGPLSDERVRRAVARAINRQELAETVLKPLGLPAQPVGSHLALAGQPAYADGSAAIGGQDTAEALALLADAGWTTDGVAGRKPVPGDGTRAGGTGTPAAPRPAASAAGTSAPAAGAAPAKPGAPAPGTVAPTAWSMAPRASVAAAPQRAARAAEPDEASDEGLYIVGDDKPRTGDFGGPEGTQVLAPASTPLQTALLRQTASQRRAATGPRAEGAAEAAGEAERAPEAENARRDGGGADDGGKNDTGRARAQGGGVPGAYAPRGTAAPAAPGADGAGAAHGALGKDGKPLTLRFVLPSGAGSDSLRAVGDRIAGMLARVGIRTEITKVSDESYFKDHIAAGEYDLALYSWPGTAFPATDGRPIFAKPEPASDGSLQVEQNYTRVGTDHIDQLLDRAAAELDEKAAADLIRQADARIWAAAGSIPLYQRPQLVAGKRNVVNAGAFGFATPHYEDIGFQGAGKDSKSRGDRAR